MQTTEDCDRTTIAFATCPEWKFGYSRFHTPTGLSSGRSECSFALQTPLSWLYEIEFGICAKAIKNVLRLFLHHDCFIVVILAVRVGSWST